MAGNNVQHMLTGVLTGTIMGIAMEKGRVFEPDVIADQMGMTNFTMMKMFLGAVATGIFAFTIAEHLPGGKEALEEARAERQNTGRGYLASLVGGALLGAGMSIAGACPGTVGAQLGAGARYAIPVIVGGLAGGTLFTYLEPSMAGWLSAATPAQHQRSLSRVVGSSDRATGHTFAFLLIAFIAFLEYVAPWKGNLGAGREALINPNASMLSLTQYAWPPYIAGAFIGLLQLPAVMLIHATMGSATTYVCTMAVWVRAISGDRTPESFKRFAMANAEQWWQLAHVLCIAVGAFLSSTMSGSFGHTNTIPANANLSMGTAFVGGFLLLFGSRMGAGCTSGHGLSGMGMLSMTSFAAVAAMFAGGMAMEFVVKPVIGL